MNQRIRDAAAAANVKLWEVADRLKIADSQFSRKLRHELPEEEQERILALIEEIRKEESK